MGPIKQITVGGGGTIYLYMNNYGVGCSSVEKRYVININDKSQEAMYAMALAALHSGKSLGVLGTNSCPDGSSEGVANTYETGQ